MIIFLFVPYLPTSFTLGLESPGKNLGSHIDASHSRQPLVKGERLVRYEVNAVMPALYINNEISRPTNKLRPPLWQAVRMRSGRARCERHADAETAGSLYLMSPQRVCCNQLGAMLVQHARAAEQARADTCPRKINVTSKSPVGDISVVTLIRTDTTLDHSQKAEKVWKCTAKQDASKTLTRNRRPPESIHCSNPATRNRTRLQLLQSDALPTEL